MSTTSLEKPLVPPAFTAISGVRKARNAVAAVLVTAAFVIAIIPLLWVLYTVVVRGYRAVLDSSWWTHSQRGILPDDFGGGIYHALYGTIVQGLIASAVAVPLGILVAIYLVEYGPSTLARTTTFMVDVLSGIPSIVAALFVFSVWITTLGFTQSAFAVSLALILLMLPVVIRSAEEMLRLVPDDLREASYALGVSRGAALRGVGHRQRHSAGRGQGDGGDRPGAGAGRVHHLHQHRRLAQQHGLAAAGDLQRADQPHGGRSTAGVGRGADPDPVDRAPQPAGCGRLPPSRAQDQVKR